LLLGAFAFLVKILFKIFRHYPHPPVHAHVFKMKGIPPRLTDG